MLHILYPIDDHPNNVSLILNILTIISLHYAPLIVSIYRLPSILVDSLYASVYYLYSQLLLISEYPMYRRSNELNPFNEFEYRLVRLCNDTLYSTPNERAFNGYCGYLFKYFASYKFS